MTGRRTHHRQMRIIEEPENTKNAPDEFDAEAELKRPPAEREARRQGWIGRPTRPTSSTQATATSSR